MMMVKQSLAFSEQHLTLNNPQFLNMAILENVSYKLDENGKLTLKTVLLDPATFQPKGAQRGAITCVLGKGVQFYTA